MENIQIHILNASNSVEVPRLSKNYLAWSVSDLCAINKLWSIMVHCADRSDPGDLGYVLLQNFLAKEAIFLGFRFLKNRLKIHI